jgi:hypothetical protein
MRAGGAHFRVCGDALGLAFLLVSTFLRTSNAPIERKRLIHARQTPTVHRENTYRPPSGQPGGRQVDDLPREDNRGESHPFPHGEKTQRAPAGAPGQRGERAGCGLPGE